MVSEMFSDISSTARIRPCCRPVPLNSFNRGQRSLQTSQRRSRRLHKPAAVAAPDRAPDAQQDAEQQQAEVLPVQQPDVAAVADATEPAAPSYDVPKLADLQLQAIINTKVRNASVHANV